MKLQCAYCYDNLEGKPFVRGNTQDGIKVVMCEGCHKYYGIGLGKKRGQLYGADGKAVKDQQRSNMSPSERRQAGVRRN